VLVSFAAVGLHDPLVVVPPMLEVPQLKAFVD